MKPVVFWGATGQARVLREALDYLGYSPLALFDNRPIASPFPGTPLYVGKEGFLTWKQSHERPEGLPFCVAIGGQRGQDRRQLQHWLEEQGLSPMTVIHPRAFVASDARLGSGSQIMAMAVVATGTTVGEAVIVNTSASVDHDCRLGDGVHIGPGARLAGEVVVESNAFVGTGAIVLPRIHIGSGAIVGAGAVVTRDVAPETTVVGHPARPRPTPF